MHEILFRGKRLDNGEWVEGFYFERKDTNGQIIEAVMIEDAYEQIAYGHRYLHSSLCSESHRVLPETVGQYTGLNDRHAKRIFENDIVEFCGGKEQRYLIWWVREMSMLTAIPVDGISFNGHDYWNGHYPQFEYSTFCLMMQDPWGDFRDICVIGNIHDNPELLNGGAEDG